MNKEDLTVSFKRLTPSIEGNRLTTYQEGDDITTYQGVREMNVPLDYDDSQVREITPEEHERYAAMMEEAINKQAEREE